MNTHKPKLVIITGRPGSGKTTLAKKLSEICYFPVVSRDEIKEGYVNTFNTKHDKLPKDTNKIASEIFFNNIEFLLSNNVSLIAEAAFQHQAWEPKITKFKNIADIFIIICELDAEISAERHLKRGINDPRREFYHGDRRVTHFKETGVLLPAGKYAPLNIDVPTIKISTLNGYLPDLESIRKHIVSLDVP